MLRYKKKWTGTVIIQDFNIRVDSFFSFVPIIERLKLNLKDASWDVVVKTRYCNKFLLIYHNQIPRSDTRHYMTYNIYRHYYINDITGTVTTYFAISLISHLFTGKLYLYCIIDKV